MPLNNESKRSLLHQLFQVGIAMRGVHVVINLVGAATIYLLSTSTIYNIITSAVAKELVEDPNDVLVRFVLQQTERITDTGRDFAILYLLVSAIFNTILIAGVMTRRPKWYVAVMVLLISFMGYECYLLVRTFSPWLMMLIVYDVGLLALLVREYRILHKNEIPLDTSS